MQQLYQMCLMISGTLIVLLAWSVTTSSTSSRATSLDWLRKRTKSGRLRKVSWPRGSNMCTRYQQLVLKPPLIHVCNVMYSLFYLYNYVMFKPCRWLSIRRFTFGITSTEIRTTTQVTMKMSWMLATARQSSGLASQTQMRSVNQTLTNCNEVEAATNCL